MRSLREIISQCLETEKKPLSPNDNRVKEFFNFAYLRHLIWYRRFKLKMDKPWTDDETLRTYKFLNVYRELDKGTIYINNYVKNIATDEGKLVAIILYKFYNTVDIFERLGVSPSDFTTDTKSLSQKLISGYKNLSDDKPVFNDAYLVTAGPGDKFINIAKSIKKFDLTKMLEEIRTQDNAEESYNKLVSLIPNCGDFLGYEIWSQLCYSRVLKYSTNDYCNVGPGAEPSITYIFGKDVDPMEALRYLQSVSYKELVDAPKRLGGKDSLGKFPSWDSIRYVCKYDKDVGNNLSLLTLENIGCEFRKYKSHTSTSKNFVSKTKYFDQEETE